MVSRFFELSHPMLTTPNLYWKKTEWGPLTVQEMGSWMETALYSPREPESEQLTADWRERSTTKRGAMHDSDTAKVPEAV